MEIKNVINRLDRYVNQTDLNRADRVQNLQRDAGTAQASTGVKTGGDTISFSSNALRTVTTQAAQQAPDVRQDKVDAIKARVDSGNYTINSRDIATKVLQAMQELG